jgi:hypothetical protein
MNLKYLKDRLIIWIYMLIAFMFAYFVNYFSDVKYEHALIAYLAVEFLHQLHIVRNVLNARYEDFYE